MTLIDWTRRNYHKFSPRQFDLLSQVQPEVKFPQKTILRNEVDQIKLAKVLERLGLAILEFQEEEECVLVKMTEEGWKAFKSLQKEGLDRVKFLIKEGRQSECKPNFT